MSDAPTAAITDSLPRVRECEGMDLTTFRNEIVPAFEPAVFRGLVRDWPAVAVGAEGAEAMGRYLLDFDSGGKVTTFMGERGIGGRFFYRDDMRSVNFEKIEESFRSAMGRVIAATGQENGPYVYIGSAPVAETAPGFAQANQLSLAPSQDIARFWIGAPSIVAPHYDLTDNIACNVMGRRRFTLFHPNQTKNLYVGPLDFTLAGPPASLVSLRDPDFERYPRFREALKNALVADLAPGDALYVPYMWWHHVEAMSPFNVMVNYWWRDAESGNPEAFEALIHAIMTIRHMPPKRRAAWKPVFEHYVFEEDGDPAAHIPAVAKGVLGPMTPRLEKIIANFLGRALSRKF